MPTPQELAIQQRAADQNLGMQGKGNPQIQATSGPTFGNAQQIANQNRLQQEEQQRQQQIANQNHLQEAEQQSKQRQASMMQGRNAGELGGNWNQTFGTQKVGGIQNPNPSWNQPAPTAATGVNGTNPLVL